LLVAASVRLIKAIGQAQGAAHGRLNAVPYYSGNGVTVNNRRITRQPLKDGDSVVIGKTQFRFVVRAARNTASVGA